MPNPDYNVTTRNAQENMNIIIASRVITDCTNSFNIRRRYMVEEMVKLVTKWIVAQIETQYY